MFNSIKQQWLDALRAPKTRQCYYALSQSVEYDTKTVQTSYCALGVLGAVGGVQQIMNYIKKFWPETGDEKVKQIVLANDAHRLSLPAIAEMIESWPDDVDPDDVVIEPVISSVTSKQKELTYV